jgi:hypothetical protein
MNEALLQVAGVHNGALTQMLSRRIPAATNEITKRPKPEARSKHYRRGATASGDSKGNCSLEGDTEKMGATTRIIAE